MDSILPIITMAQLQRQGKDVLAKVQDYAVIQSHGHDRAFVLSPRLGRVLLESGLLEVLKKKAGEKKTTQVTDTQMKGELEGLIGNVLKELSKR